MLPNTRFLCFCVQFKLVLKIIFSLGAEKIISVYVCAFHHMPARMVFYS